MANRFLPLIAIACTLALFGVLGVVLFLASRQPAINITKEGVRPTSSGRSPEEEKKRGTQLVFP
jgi:hypothetical protein